MSEKNNFKFKRGRYPIKKKSEFFIRNLRNFPTKCLVLLAGHNLKVRFFKSENLARIQRVFPTFVGRIEPGAMQTMFLNVNLTTSG